MAPLADVPTEPAAASRRGLMRVLAVALALSPFLILELGLRHFSPAADTAIDRQPVVDLEQLQPLFELNASSDRWQIPPWRLNFFCEDSFSADKPPGSRRIFVLGGSTVQGRPFSIETSFASWLKLHLQAASPNTTFEVVNCGGISYASYRVSKILDEVLQHDPDAIVIYTGHNEFLEDREYAEVRELSGAMRVFARAASRVRTITWIQSKLEPPAPSPQVMATEVDAMLDHIGGLARYERDPGWKKSIESHFAETLEQMVTKTKQAGVPLVLCEPASDIVDTPPFKVTLPPLDSSSQYAFDQAWSRAKNDRLSARERLIACEKCLEVDPGHAGALYLAGRLQFESRAYESARNYLTAARDLDVCPLRATTPIIESVRQVATNHNVPLVRTVELFDQRNQRGQAYQDGIADPDLFIDHLHPTVAGHRQLGKAVAQQIVKLGWFEVADDAELRFQQMVTDHLDTLGEEYYARGRQRLEGLRRWASGRAHVTLPLNGPPP